MNITWRPYQKNMFLIDEKADQKNIRRRGIISATGTGKRLMAVGLSLKYKKVLFLCHTEELIEQAREDFEKVYPLQVGIVKAERFEINNRIVIASAQTIWRRLDKMPEDMFDCVMADEVHHYLARTYIMPLKHFKYKVCYGFTATPTRLDGLDFGNILDELTFNYPLDQAIKEGYLCQLDAVRVPTNIDLSKVKRVRGDFAKNELNSAVDIPKRNKLIVEKYKQYSHNRQALIFCTGIDHAETLAEMFNDAFDNKHRKFARAIHSNLHKDERRLINKEYKSGIVKVLTNVNILTEGWDYSEVGCILMARPTESLALYMQMIGRGTRLKSDKYKKIFMTAACKIIDFVDNVGNHELINTWSLDKDKKVKDKTFVTDKTRKKLISDLLLFNEKRIMKIKRMYGGDDRPVDLLRLPVQKRVRNSAHWYDEPATEKQLNFLKNLGVYDNDIEYSKGQASNAIGNRPADEWMIKKLASWNSRVLNMETGDTLHITVGQFMEVQNKLFPKEKPNKINSPVKL